MVVFSSSPWLFLPPAVAGCCLTYFLYRRHAVSTGDGFRRVLSALSVAAWLGLAGLLAQPSWITTQVTYHPPMAVLAVDRSASFDAGTALGAAGAVRRSMEAVRRHYAAQGFQIREIDFAETVRIAGVQRTLGVLSSLESLRRYLDSADFPNLQGVFAWTDGRFNLDTGSDLEASWPAPLFPVAMATPSSEVQGEHVDLDLKGSDSGAAGTAVWRLVGRSAGNALLELKAGVQVVWRETLPRPDAFTGSEVPYRFRLSGPATRAAVAASSLTALIRPERSGDDAVIANDTVDLRLAGRVQGRNLFMRPLQSLEERGLIDALYASESLSVATVDPESLATESLRNGDLLWVRDVSSALNKALRTAADAGIPAMIYSLPAAKASTSAPVFSGAARVVWSEAASGVLPAGVVRLADLGAGDWALDAPDSTETPIAWAEENGKRGVLFAALRGSEAAPVFGFADPPLWNFSFRADPDPRIAQLQQQWVAGVLDWVRRHRNRLQVRVPEVLLAQRKFFLTLIPGSTTDSAAHRWELRIGSSPRQRMAATSGDGEGMRFGPLVLPAGSLPVEIVDGEKVLWRDTLTIRDPVLWEQSRLGIDVEGLTRIASVTRGFALRDFSDSGGGEELRRALPALPRGQTRIEARKTFAVLPFFWIALWVALCLSSVWALRKKLQLD